MFAFSSMGILAQGFIALGIRESAFFVPLVIFAFSAAGGVFKIIGGVCADFWDRRKLLIIAAVVYAFLALVAGVVISLGMATAPALVFLALALGSAVGFALVCNRIHEFLY